jgi:hypothetical protein
MSHQQTAPTSQQPTKTVPPAVPHGPQPIPQDLLRHVSGGETDIPNKGW